MQQVATRQGLTRTFQGVRCRLIVCGGYLLRFRHTRDETETSAVAKLLARLQAAFGKGPVPVGELVAAGLGGARSRAIAFKAIADGLPPQYRLRTRLVRAPYPQA